MARARTSVPDRPLQIPLGRLIAVVAAAGLGTGLGAGSSHAQQQVNTGNALDANPQIGTNGTNAAAIQPDFRGRNLLITGQVTDGRQFRGDIGYGAAGAFGGTLGSDDLFRFRADSFTSSPAARSLGVSGPAGTAGPPVIFNNFFTGTVQTGVGGGNQTIVSSDGSRVGIYNNNRLVAGNGPEGPGLSRTFTAGPGGLADTAPGAGGTLGTIRGDDGRLLQVRADPLTGVQRVEVPTPNVTGIDPDAPDVVLPTNARLDSRVDPVAARDGSDPFADPASADPASADPATAAGGVGAAPGERLDLQRGNTLVADRTADSLRDGRLTGIPRTLQIGAALRGSELERDAAAGASDADSPTRAERQADRIRRLTDDIFGDGTRSGAGRAGDAGADNPYADVVRRIRGESDGETERVDLSRPEWMRDLEADGPGDAEVDAAERRRREVIDRILGGRGDGENDRRGRGGGGTDGGVDPAESFDREPAMPVAANSPELNALIDQLSYELPRLEALQGEKDSRVNRSFETAQVALAEGRYFNAESLYEQLIRDAPDNPLARVGQVHAEMGGGMIRSAAFHLRAFFEDHPELIALRYDAKLLPEPERLDWLRDQLQTQLEDDTIPAAEPGLMAAYLRWQIESRQLVRYGLARAQESQPLDPLLPVLRRIWLGEAE